MTSSTGQPKRLVLDSNIWVSALVFGGKPRQIFMEAATDGYAIVVSEQLYTEVRRVLTAKFPAFLESFEDLVATLAAPIVMVRLGSITITVCRDPDDNKILETAVLGNATLIISGDKDLLVLATHHGIPIVTPSSFLLPAA